MEEESFSSGESGAASSDDDERIDDEEEEEEDEEEGEKERERTLLLHQNKDTFLCYDRTQSIGRQREVLDTAIEALGVQSRSVARALLRLFSWRLAEAASSAVVAQEEVCKQLKINGLHGKGGSLVKKGAGCCCICFNDDDLLGLDVCLDSQHSFCKNCWVENIETQVTSKQCPLVTCMGDKCAAVLEDQKVAELLESKLRKIYLSQLVDSFLSNNSNVCFCPSESNCPGIIERLNDFSLKMCCSFCQTDFCFQCKQRPHAPATCAGFRVFISKIEDTEQLSERIVNATSKACPKCGARIFKASGCNHVTCSACTFHFCWQCEGKFGSGPMGGSDGYGSHQCSGIGKDVKNLDEFVVSDEQYRFNWFCDRYLLNLNAAKLGRELQIEMRRDSDFEKDFAFVAMETLYWARMMLGDANVRAFSRLTSSKSFIDADVFEFRMQTLSQLIDQLSSLVETPLRNKKKTTIDMSRVKIISLISAIKEAMDALVEAANDGQDAREIRELAKKNSIKQVQSTRFQKRK